MSHPEMTVTRMKRIALCVVMLLFGPSVFALDDAERLSRKVPGQVYRARNDVGLLEKGEIQWGIPLWSCTPGSFKIIKVLNQNSVAPYAVEITVAPKERIYGAPYTLWTLRTIHILALSLDDAQKIRRALIAEIEPMRRFIEKKQGNPPGYLKRQVESQNR